MTKGSFELVSESKLGPKANNIQKERVSLYYHIYLPFNQRTMEPQNENCNADKY